MQCVGFRNLIQQYNTVNGQEWKLHFWDYVICFFQGTVPYAQSEGKETFNIPPYWSLYLIYFVLLIGKLTGQLSKKYEQQMLLSHVLNHDNLQQLNIQYIEYSERELPKNGFRYGRNTLSMGNTFDLQKWQRNRITI